MLYFVYSSQQLQSYAFHSGLDTSSLSAETICQLRAVESNSGVIASVGTARPTPVFEPTPTATSEDIESEVIQLRSALSERTVEAQRLAEELERANRIVEELRELCQDHSAAASASASAVFA